MKRLLPILSLVNALVLCGCTPDSRSNNYSDDGSIITKITLRKGYGASGGTESVVASYGQEMPSISIPRKSGATFFGYFDAPQDEGGTKYYTSSGASARKWDKKVSSYHLYAHWSDSNGGGENSNGGNGGNNGSGSTYSGNSIKNISNIEFQTTQFGAGTGYFVGGISLNSGYVASSTITCTITVTITVYYIPTSSTPGATSYTDTKTTSMSMTISTGGTSATGRCSVSWQTTTSRGGIAYRSTDANYVNRISSITGTAKTR